MLGLLGLRIFEATGANIAGLGEEHSHRVLRVRGKVRAATSIARPEHHSQWRRLTADSRTISLAGPEPRQRAGRRVRTR
jgi:integrase/recombinase XerD